jgi:hypothetical protein
MTRENKAGLVVSCSFLCLVGTVLALKLREPAGPDKSPAPGDQAANNKGLPPDPIPLGPETQPPPNGKVPEPPETSPATPKPGTSHQADAGTPAPKPGVTPTQIESLIANAGLGFNPKLVPQQDPAKTNTSGAGGNASGSGPSRGDPTGPALPDPTPPGSPQPVPPGPEQAAAPGQQPRPATLGMVARAAAALGSAKDKPPTPPPTPPSTRVADGGGFPAWLNETPPGAPPAPAEQKLAPAAIKQEAPAGGQRPAPNGAVTTDRLPPLPGLNPDPAPPKPIIPGAGGAEGTGTSIRRPTRPPVRVIANPRWPEKGL